MQIISKGIDNGEGKDEVYCIKINQ
jgi:hypothetical protein